MIFSRKILLSAGLILISLIAEGQQVPVFDQYIMNGYLVNPSLAGRDGYTTVNLTVREQWMGMKDAPSTYVASFQTTLLRNSYILHAAKIKKKVSRPTKPSRVGIGASVFNDVNGLIRRTGIKFDYAYHIPMGDKKTSPNDLSLGLGVVTYLYGVKVDQLQYSYNNDPFFNAYDRSVFVTDFSFGSAYTTDKFYVGFSMTNILRGNLVYGNAGDNKNAELGNFFLTGGTNIPINKEWSVKPSAFIKASDMAFKTIQADITGRVFYKESYWAGLSYRTGDAIILLVGLKYGNFYFSNSYDFPLSAIRNATFGSYEVSVAYKFGDSPRRYRWLNSF